VGWSRSCGAPSPDRVKCAGWLARAASSRTEKRGGGPAPQGPIAAPDSTTPPAPSPTPFVTPRTARGGHRGLTNNSRMFTTGALLSARVPDHHRADASKRKGLNTFLIPRHFRCYVTQMVSVVKKTKIVLSVLVFAVKVLAPPLAAPVAPVPVSTRSLGVAPFGPLETPDTRPLELAD
jgi:hypothetical protein